MLQMMRVLRAIQHNLDAITSGNSAFCAERTKVASRKERTSAVTKGAT